MCRPYRVEDRWPTEHETRRVLVEDPDGAMRAVCERNLADEGFQVATCGGPRTLPRGRCPLAMGAECPLAAGADVIYTSLDWHDSSSRQVLDALVDRYADKPVVVAAGPRDAYLVESFAEQCHVVPPPRGRGALLAAICRATNPLS